VVIGLNTTSLFVRLCATLKFAGIGRETKWVEAGCSHMAKLIETKTYKKVNAPLLAQKTC
jgi:hypothetical protein